MRPPPRQQPGAIQRASRGADDEVKAGGQPEQLNRGSHSSRDYAAHPAALDRERRPGGVGPRGSLAGALSPPGKQLEHGMSHDEVRHCTLQHTRACHASRPANARRSAARAAGAAQPPRWQELSPDSNQQADRTPAQLSVCGRAAARCPRGRCLQVSDLQAKSSNDQYRARLHRRTCVCFAPGSPNVGRIPCPVVDRRRACPEHQLASRRSTRELRAGGPPANSSLTVDLFSRAVDAMPRPAYCPAGRIPTARDPSSSRSSCVTYWRRSSAARSWGRVARSLARPAAVLLRMMSLSEATSICRPAAIGRGRRCGEGPRSLRCRSAGW